MKYRIAVIGCGIAGSLVAWLLKLQGHEVTIFEQSQQLAPVGAGIMLQPLGQCVLDRVGLLDRAIAKSEPIHQLHATYRSGRTMIRMPFEASGTGMHAYGVHRGDMFDVLHDQVSRENIEVVLGAHVDSLNRNDKTIDIVCGDERVFKGYDKAIITNGSRSTLRAQTPFQCMPREYSHAAIWCNASMPSGSGQLLQIVEGTKHLMGILPLGQGRASLFWGLPCRDHERCMQQPIESWRDAMKTFYPPACDVIDSIVDWKQTTYGTYRRASVRPVFDERVLFLGDAAHSMSPHLGQGLNFALLDALRFALTMEKHGEWSSACDEFVKLQSNHLRYYRFVTALLTPFFQSDDWWRGLFRDLTLPWLHRTPIIRQQMALTMTGLKSGFLGGELCLE